MTLDALVQTLTGVVERVELLERKDNDEMFKVDKAKDNLIKRLEEEVRRHQKMENQFEEFKTFVMGKFEQFKVDFESVGKMVDTKMEGFFEADRKKQERQFGEIMLDIKSALERCNDHKYRKADMKLSGQGLDSDVSPTVHFDEEEIKEEVEKVLSVSVDNATDEEEAHLYAHAQDAQRRGVRQVQPQFEIKSAQARANRDDLVAEDANKLKTPIKSKVSFEETKHEVEDMGSGTKAEAKSIYKLGDAHAQDAQNRGVSGGGQGDFSDWSTSESDVEAEDVKHNHMDIHLSALQYMDMRFCQERDGKEKDSYSKGIRSLQLKCSVHPVIV